MVDQNTFTVTLQEVAEIIRTSAIPMSREEILSYFGDMELTPEQEDMVFTYLSTPHEEMPAQDTDTDTDEEASETEDGESADAPDEDALEALAQESAVFRMYMDEVAALPAASADEMNELYHRLQQGDTLAAGQILPNWLPMVLQASKKYFKNKVNLEDVIQEGNMGLFMKLTELTGTDMDIMKIQMELNRAMQEAMRNYISEVSGEEDSEDTIAGKANLVAQAKKAIADTNGAEPTLEELSAYTNMTTDELTDILDIMKKAQDAADKKKA